MKTIAFSISTLYLAVALLPACGGAGNGNNGPSSSQPTTAVLKLATSGLATTIHGIDVTVNLPSGVTVKNTANPPQTDDGVVTPSGEATSGSFVTSSYSAETGTLPGKVRILLVNSAGFSAGEFCAVKCDLAAGQKPTTADFSLTGFTASDENGGVINGLNAGLSADIH